MMNKLKIGFALCGSFCTIPEAFDAIKELLEEGHTVYPIISEIVSKTDTRFGNSETIKATLREMTKNDVIDSIKLAEPIGPNKLLDILIIAPCTGNTLAKLASGVTDTAVTMAAKAHIRNNRPIIIALATNDALGVGARNIGTLINRKNIFFVPMAQDDPDKKPTSMISDFKKIKETAEAAINGKQLQPVYI